LWAEHAWDHEDRDSPDDVNGLIPTDYRRLGGWAGFDAEYGTNSARVGINFNQFDFDDVEGTSGNLGRDSEGFAFAIGLDGTYGALSGEVLVGFLMQDYADPGLEDVATFDIGAALKWTPAPLTRMRLSVDRSIEESTLSMGGVPASSYTATSLRVRAAHRVAKQVSIGADIA
jgi:hypothetical protein